MGLWCFLLWSVFPLKVLVEHGNFKVLISYGLLFLRFMYLTFFPHSIFLSLFSLDHKLVSMYVNHCVVPSRKKRTQKNTLTNNFFSTQTRTGMK